MRNGQNKRMRGRNNRKGQNPLTRIYESNGPDVKIRGTANHVAEKYVQLARDAQSSGDPVAAENYFQHAEHYFRLIAAAQEQFRQANPYYRPEGGENRDDTREEAFDDGDEGGAQPFTGAAQSSFQQPYPQHQQHQPREQPYPPREQPYLPREPQPQPSRAQPVEAQGEGDRLPSFITGGQPPAHQGHGPNGYDGNQGGDRGGDRFPLHRRRRRHRGPRGDIPGTQGVGEGGDDSAPRGPRPND